MREPGSIELYLLRHAHAGDPLAWSGPDELRPLSKKGHRQSERLGSFLAGLAFHPDVIVTSPKVRARQTAEDVATILGLGVVDDDRLAFGFDLAALEGLLADHADASRVMVVGHDPDFSELLDMLVDAPGLVMRKGALARVDLIRPAGPGDGALRWLVPPDLLDPER